MSISKIRIKNVLSFEDMTVRDMSLINCTLGKNNSGKSNLFKLINFFYLALEDKRVLAPELLTNYDSKGSIELTFDTSHINRVVHSKRNSENNYFNKIKGVLFDHKFEGRKKTLFKSVAPRSEYNTISVTLDIFNDGTFKFKRTSREMRKLILDIFPLFEIDSRKINLHDWDELWIFLGKLRPFNALDFEKEFSKFIDESENLTNYKRNIEDVNRLSNTTRYEYKEKVANFLKAGLKGDKFKFEGVDLRKTSDGTNSYNHIITVIRLVSSLSKRSYQSPVIYIDEPELGLHPKMNEKLIYELKAIIHECFYKDNGKKTSSPPPTFIFSTHSPNIVKQVIKSFQGLHKIYHFSNDKNKISTISNANSNFDDSSTLSNFSDNEARLFFSSFILFVEGQTEIELFSNDSLLQWFPHLIGVDIYQSSNEKINKKITPDFINTSVPYLFLYDADKVVNVKNIQNKDDSIIEFKKSSDIANLNEKELDRMSKKFKLGFCPKNERLGYVINNIRNFASHSDKVSTTKLMFKGHHSYINFYKNINELLYHKRCYIASTTIEGSLINYDSRELFYSWLEERKKIPMDSIVARFKNSKYLSERVLIQYLRIIFNGKSDTLVRKKGFEKNKLTDKRASIILRWLEKNAISNHKLSKTDGWVSSFMDYAIESVSREVKGDRSEFLKLFSKHFKELYDILTLLRYGS